MDTHMDTRIHVVFPIHILQFSIGDNIVSSKDWSRFMTWDGHEGELIVSGKLWIVDWAMPKVMEGEVPELWLYDGLITLKLEGTLEGSDRFSLILTLMVQIFFILKT
jgi:hypothetical protein